MSLAGPAANVLVAIVIAILLQVLPMSTSYIWPGLSFLFALQLWAAIFNLLPVPGLDGYGVIEPFLHPAIQAQIDVVRPFAIWILILAIWYINGIGEFFWQIVYFISLPFQINWDLVVQGQDFLFNFFR
jgi:Zn-dependent protease